MKQPKYRFVLLLDPEARRKLAELQAAAIQSSGRLMSAAGVLRQLIMEAKVAKGGGEERA